LGGALKTIDGFAKARGGFADTGALLSFTAETVRRNSSR